jgi:hypothetical protein
LKGRNYFEDMGVNEKMILEWILGKQREGVDWIHLAQDRDQWWALVKSVMKLRVP